MKKNQILIMEDLKDMKLNFDSLDGLPFYEGSTEPDSSPAEDGDRFDEWLEERRETVCC